eukprot:9482451-Pyramimonas_sp.AAC.1
MRVKMRMRADRVTRETEYLALWHSASYRQTSTVIIIVIASPCTPLGRSPRAWSHLHALHPDKAVEVNRALPPCTPPRRSPRGSGARGRRGRRASPPSRRGRRGAGGPCSSPPETSLPAAGAAAAARAARATRQTPARQRGAQKARKGTATESLGADQSQEAREHIPGAEMCFKNVK